MDVDRVKDRLRKLLRLARESNEVGEAAAAAAQAQALMSKYQLEEASLTDLDDAPRLEQAWGDDGLFAAKRLPYWVLCLVTNVSDLNNCVAFVQISEGKRAICLVGSAENIALVRYMCLYLRREVARLCKVYAVPTVEFPKKGIKWSNSFKLGVVHEVVSRMGKAKEDEFKGASSRALVHIDAVRLAAQEWLRDHATSKPRAPKKRDSDPSAYVQGRVVGRSILLEGGKALGDAPKQLDAHSAEGSQGEGPHPEDTVR